MVEKKKLTDEERAVIAAEAKVKIEAAKTKQAELQEYGVRVSKMTRKQKVRELNRIEGNGGLDAALAIALRIVLTNTRVSREDANELVAGKLVFRPNWINEEGKVSSYLR
jgi:hypothetical protein